jgi:hypothetical protein
MTAFGTLSPLRIAAASEAEAGCIADEGYCGAESQAPRASRTSPLTNFGSYAQAEPPTACVGSRAGEIGGSNDRQENHRAAARVLIWSLGIIRGMVEAQALERLERRLDEIAGTREDRFGHGHTSTDQQTSPN